MRLADLVRCETNRGAGAVVSKAFDRLEKLERLAAMDIPKLDAEWIYEIVVKNEVLLPHLRQQALEQFPDLTETQHVEIGLVIYKELIQRSDVRLAWEYPKDDEGNDIPVPTEVTPSDLVRPSPDDNCLVLTTTADDEQRAALTALQRESGDYVFFDSDSSWIETFFTEMDELERGAKETPS